MKDLLIDSVQFALITRRWNDETLGAIVRALVDSALQDGAKVRVLDSSFCEYNMEGLHVDEDSFVDGTTDFSCLQEREGD